VDLALDRLADTRSPDTESLAAAVIVLLETGDVAFAEHVVRALLAERGETRWAVWWGLRLGSIGTRASLLDTLVREQSLNFAWAAAVDVLAFHRQPVRLTVDLGTDADADVTWLLAEAAGRVPGAWTVTHLRRCLEHPSSRVRTAALRASARSGVPELTVVCRDATETGSVPEAIEFLGVVGSDADLVRLERAVANSAIANASVRALGRLALPGAVPLLLDILDRPELADAAANALARIAGEELLRDDAPPSPSEDDVEPAAPMNAARARAWWAANASRFESRKRYQAGRCVSDDPLGLVFQELSPAIRDDVYLRQRALVPRTPDWELETWPWKVRNPAR
jgi:hypothetical protein